MKKRSFFSRVRSFFDLSLMPWEDPAPVSIAADPEDYEKLGLKQGPPEPWEDGMTLAL